MTRCMIMYDNVWSVTFCTQNPCWTTFSFTIFITFNASVNSACAQPPPPPGLTPGHWHFLGLGWKIPGGGDFWAVKSPGVGTKKENKCPVLHQPLCEMSCVMVPILVDTNPYSWEKRKYGEVSGSGHAAYTLSIRTRIFPESNFFRGMEYPISGHVIETRRVKTCKRPYFSRFAENHGVPLTNATIFAFHFH